MSNFLDQTAEAAIIPEVWGNLALGHLPGYLNLGRTVARDTDFTTAQEGDIIHVSRRGALSANQMTENSTVTRQKPSRTDITVTLNNHWEITVGQTDITKALARGQSLEEYIGDAVAVLGEKIEDSLAGLHTSVTNTVAAANPVTEANILAVRERMKQNKVPKTQRLYGYVDPTVMTDLLSIARATESDKRGDSVNMLVDPTADLVFHKINFFEGSAVRRSGSPGAYHNLFYTRNAMVLAMRPLPLPEAGTGATGVVLVDDNGFMIRVVKSWDSNYLANQVTLDVLFGTAILDSRLIVEMESF